MSKMYLLVWITLITPLSVFLFSPICLIGELCFSFHHPVAFLLIISSQVHLCMLRFSVLYPLSYSLILPLLHLYDFGCIVVIALQ